MFPLRDKFDVIIRIMQMMIKMVTGKTIEHVQTNSSLELGLELLNEHRLEEVIMRHHTSAIELPHVVELIS